jgi:hypothetical protein
MGKTGMAKNYTGSIFLESDDDLLVEVIETDVFVNEADRLLSTPQIEELKYCVASMREIGEIIPGTEVSGSLGGI